MSEDTWQIERMVIRRLPESSHSFTLLANDRNPPFAVIRAAVILLRKGALVMVLSRKRLALAIALLLPMFSVIALSVPPWSDWFPHARNIGRPWLYATVAAGSIGILLLPWTPLRKLIALTLYLPAMLLFLIVLIVGLTCVAHGPGACP